MPSRQTATTSALGRNTTHDRQQGAGSEPDGQSPHAGVASGHPPSLERPSDRRAKDAHRGRRLRQRCGPCRSRGARMTAPAPLRMLARRTMGASSASVFAVGSSAPMVVIVGAIPAMYGNTGVLGVPLGYLVVAAVLALLASGYASMSAQLKHPAPF